MSKRSSLVSSLAGPFKRLARRMLGERVYQQTRVTLLGETGGLGLDWSWGNSLRRVHLVRRDFGWQIGLPINRYYTEQHFFPAYQQDIRGRVLEVADSRYTRQLGADRVTVSDVLHVDGDSPGVTVQGDLTNADHISPLPRMTVSFSPLPSTSFLTCAPCSGRLSAF